MATETLSNCPSCGYPVRVEYEGQTAVCAYCGEKLEATIQQEVAIPTWLLASLIGLGIGIVVGPAIIASTEEGAQWLQRQARKKIGG